MKLTSLFLAGVAMRARYQAACEACQGPGISLRYVRNAPPEDVRQEVLMRWSDAAPPWARRVLYEDDPRCSK